MARRPDGPVRVLVLWSPDWPVTAAARAAHVPPHRPAAVFLANRVLACSAVARAHGVRRGLRRREAQARCPQLAVLTPDPDRDARAFEPVVAAVEELAPGVEVVRPGLVALPARGPVGHFGGEQAAAERLVDQVAARTGVESQVGVADGLFGAVLAARRGLAVAPGDTPAFLAPLGVEELDREPDVDRADLVDLLHRLGLRSLGAFARLDPQDVASRFGGDAVLAHRLARGLDPRPPLRRRPPEDLTVELELDPPVDRVDAAAFAARGLADRLHSLLAGHGLACTRIGVGARTAEGEELHRVWRCAEPLTPSGTVDRVRWQLDAWLTTHARREAARRAGGVPAGGAVPVGPGRTGPGRACSGGVDPAGSGRADPAGPGRVHPAARPTGGPAAGPAGAQDDEPHATGPGAVVRLWLVPEETVLAGALQLGLWGDAGEAGERAARSLVRVQALLGPESVVTAVLGGGRDPADRPRTVPWGDDREDPVLPSDAPPGTGGRTALHGAVVPVAPPVLRAVPGPVTTGPAPPAVPDTGPAAGPVITGPPDGGAAPAVSPVDGAQVPVPDTGPAAEPVITGPPGGGAARAVSPFGGLRAPVPGEVSDTGSAPELAITAPPGAGPVPDEPRPAPAGWPDDVLRSTGRRTSAMPPERSDARRRRVPTRRSPRPAGHEPPASWPGRLPAPSPATVPERPVPAELLDAGGRPVRLAAPDLLAAPPARLRIAGAGARPVRGWAGPWPAQERWWVPGAVLVGRLQVLCGAPDGDDDDSGSDSSDSSADTAYLLRTDGTRWWVVGVYD